MLRRRIGARVASRRGVEFPVSFVLEGGVLPAADVVVESCARGRRESGAWTSDDCGVKGNAHAR